MRRSLLAVALTGVLLAACGDGSSRDASGAPAPAAAAGTSPSPAGTPAPVASAAASVEAPAALQFVAPLVGGGSIDFTSFAGRTVALWFWAPT